MLFLDFTLWKKGAQMSKPAQPDLAPARVAEDAAAYPAPVAPGTGVPKSLYDRDFALWVAEQADVLRRRDFGHLDLQNLIEECESMGRSEHREIRSRLTVLLMHLLKHEFQPESRLRSWRSTIHEQRSEILAVLEDSPSLRPTVAAKMDAVYPVAAERVSMETGLPIMRFPARSPYSDAQVLDVGFYPGPVT
jgi:hypothetical protein